MGPGPWLRDECPGYYLSQPQVAEAALAVDAYRNQSLHLYFPGQENPLLEAAQELHAAYSRYEAERLKQRQKELSNG